MFKDLFLFGKFKLIKTKTQLTAYKGHPPGHYNVTSNFLYSPVVTDLPISIIPNHRPGISFSTNMSTYILNNRTNIIKLISNNLHVTLLPKAVYTHRKATLPTVAPKLFPLNLLVASGIQLWFTRCSYRHAIPLRTLGIQLQTIIGAPG